MVFSKEILESIFSHQTSFLIDMDLRVSFVSQSLLKLLNKSESDLLGSSLEALAFNVSTTDKLRSNFQKALKGEVVIGEDLFTTIEGPEVYYEYTLAPLKNKEAKVFSASALLRDISDRKKIELELKRNVAALQVEQELRESFITAMSHDLRTPLTAAKLSAQIIQKHPSDNTAIIKFSGRIIENIERTDLMMRDLLDSLRIKSGESIMLNVQQDIMNALLETLVIDYKRLHGDRFEVVMNEMVKGYWDSNAIRRVLENLLSNALKYGKPNARITIKLFKESGFDCVSVINEGEGLTPQEISQLFVPFKRLKKAQDSGFKGWGIGLTLVKGILEAHQGLVEVESQLDKGSTFTIKIPN